MYHHSFSNARKINLVGSSTVGYVGEVADELLIANSLTRLGQHVNFIPRDIWKAHCDGETNVNWNKHLDVTGIDINIICKWGAFNDEKYINKLREKYHSPVFYWVWDYMQNEEFHLKCINACDLYLSNDIYSGKYNNNKCYYFPFDVADGCISQYNNPKVNDVVFFGSCLEQGERKEWLQEINKHCNLVVYSWNYKEWEKLGLKAFPPVWGEEFAQRVSESCICLQFSVNDDTWGYWSNRVGKIMTQGGFILAHYAPGMELFLRDGVEYFCSIKECIYKINYYLEHRNERYEIAKRGMQIGLERFTVDERVKDLLILIDRKLNYENC